MGGTGTAKAVLRLGYTDRFSAGARDIYRLPRLQTGSQTQPTPHHWIPEDLSLDHRSPKPTTYRLTIEYEAGGPQRRFGWFWRTEILTHVEFQPLTVLPVDSRYTD